jgi:hypothetical protein
MQQLPNIANARLPKTYEHARLAIQKCKDVDECKDWKDKAAALASYAKQAKDETLYKNALKIQARAIERCGELLQEVEDKRGPSKKGFQAKGARNSRTARADGAGLSEHEKKTALRVANVPKAERDRQIESDDPPTIAKLAAQGKKSKPKPLFDLGGRTPEAFKAATTLMGFVGYIIRNSEGIDPKLAIDGLTTDEHKKLKTDLRNACKIIIRLSKQIGR